MRVTTNMLGDNLLNNLQISAGALLKLQNQLSSGKKITKPSDDPVGIQNSMRFKSTQNAVDLWQSNAKEAITYMQTTDSAMTQIGSMLNRVRTLAVQAANGDLTGDQRTEIQAEVDELSKQIQVVSNNKVGNRYLFGGINNQEPMPAALASGATLSGAQSAWHGSNAALSSGAIVTYQVGDNLSGIGISVDGSDFFPQIFYALSQLSANLSSNNQSGIGTSLDELDAGSNALLKNQAQLGAKTNRMTAIQSQLQDTSDNLAQNISNIEDLDYAKAIIDYQTQENSYRAALQVGMNIIQPSLVNFMSN